MVRCRPSTTDSVSHRAAVSGSRSRLVACGRGGGGGGPCARVEAGAGAVMARDKCEEALCRGFNGGRTCAQSRVVSLAAAAQASPAQPCCLHSTQRLGSARFELFGFFVLSFPSPLQQFDQVCTRRHYASGGQGGGPRACLSRPIRKRRRPSGWMTGAAVFSPDGSSIWDGVPSLHVFELVFTVCGNIRSIIYSLS